MNYRQTRSWPCTNSNLQVEHKVTPETSPTPDSPTRADRTTRTRGTGQGATRRGITTLPVVLGTTERLVGITTIPATTTTTGTDSGLVMFRPFVTTPSVYEKNSAHITKSKITS